MRRIELRTFTEEEYHDFFRNYISDPMMDPSPFHYNHEQITRSYAYNHGGFRKDYVHLGIFFNGRAVGSFQLKRMDLSRKTCEFGIILQNDSVKNCGIGTQAVMEGMKLARDRYGMEIMHGDTMRRNLKMIRVFEKIGFNLVEIIPGAYEMPDGRKEDRLVYSIKLTEGYTWQKPF